MRPRWLAKILLANLPYGCEECDDTGIKEYIGVSPFYCFNCEKGERMRRESERKNRIRGMESELARDLADEMARLHYEVNKK